MVLLVYKYNNKQKENENDIQIPTNQLLQKIDTMKQNKHKKRKNNNNNNNKMEPPAKKTEIEYKFIGKYPN